VRFYDIHVHSDASIGENSIEEIIEQAKRLELTGIAVTDYFSSLNDIKQTREKISNIDTDLDIALGAVIRAETSDQLKKMVKDVRKHVDLVLVHGGDYRINREAVEMPEVDVLCHPELDRRDSGMDHITAKSAAENKVAIEINFREILESFKKHRVYVISNMKKNIFLAKKYEAPIVATSGAASIWGMRAGRELAAFAFLLGLPLSGAINTVSAVPEKIIHINREKLAGKRLPGVKVAEEENKGKGV